jgi:hypothetical protein
VTAAVAFERPEAEPRRATPCIAADEDARHCIAGFLLGVACCPDATCALCRASEDRMLRQGFAPDVVARSIARRHEGLVDRCPVCGFPPPPPLDALPPLTRLDRSDLLRAPTTHCVQCGRQLVSARRRYCSNDCWNAYVAWSRHEQRLARL